MFREDFNKGPAAPGKTADPFSLEALIAWLEKQPAQQCYDYWDHEHCLLGQYFATFGATFIGSFIAHREQMYVLDGIAGNGTWTFGAALQRAKRALESRHA